MDKEHSPEPPEPEARSTGLSAFLKELKRRHVVRVAMVYAIVGWLVIQVANATFEDFGIPAWAYRFVVLMVALGFPISVVVAWAFELTPQGIKTTKTAKEQKSEEPASSAFRHKRQWFTILFAAGLPTTIFGALAVYFYATRLDSSPSTLDSSPSPHQVEGLDKSIAVLPLENLSPDPDNAFFADGVQEDILTHLSKIKELGVVISRSSTLKYRGPDRNLKQVGQELGVRYIVEGSVRRAANQVRVTVQLIDSQTDDHLWAENYDRSLDNIFTIQSEIAKKIADQLQAVISPQEIAQIEIRPTENQEAYDFYLRARSWGTSRTDVGPLHEKAVALDPQFYRAWAELASWCFQRWNNSSQRQDAELLSKGQRAFEKLKRLAPNSPELLIVQSTYADEVEDDLESSIDFALKARLKGLFERDLGYRYLKLGRLDEAQLYLEEIVRKEPDNGSDSQRLFHIYTLKEMWREAEALIERNLELRAGGKISMTELFWQNRTSYLDFLKNGDREVYEIGARDSSGDPGGVGQYLSSLLARNFKPDFEYFNNNRRSLNITAGMYNPPSQYGWRIGPDTVVSALVQFELGEKNKSLEYADKAANFLQKSVDGDHKARPYDLANLTICHALNQDREQVESTIPRIRALTEDVNWKYREQVTCEMKIAVAYLVLGDRDKAIETLEAASKMDGPIFLNRELDLWFIFDRLRGNPRFDALLEG